eukprot:6892022-Prorocentrum_lima.AAC.1
MRARSLREDSAFCLVAALAAVLVLELLAPCRGTRGASSSALLLATLLTARTGAAAGTALPQPDEDRAAVPSRWWRR